MALDLRQLQGVQPAHAEEHPDVAVRRMGAMGGCYGWLLGVVARGWLLWLGTQSMEARMEAECPEKEKRGQADQNKRF